MHLWIVVLINNHVAFVEPVPDGRFANVGQCQALLKQETDAIQMGGIHFAPGRTMDCVEARETPMVIVSP